MPNFASNIQSKMFYEEYGLEIITNARVTSTKTIFINHSSTLISRMIYKGWHDKAISKTLSKAFGQHFETTLLEKVETICTWNKYTSFFWLGQIMDYSLCSNTIWLLQGLWGGRVLLLSNMLNATVRSQALVPKN